MQACVKCGLKDTCKAEKITCNAITELSNIYNQDSAKRRSVLIRALRTKLGIRDAEPSKELKTLAESIISKFPEFAFISIYGIKVGYVLSYEAKKGEKIVFADCRKLNAVYQAYLPFDFIITFYHYNTEMLNENQKKILMLHELRHIQLTERGLSVRPHDIEDFKEILSKYGLDWAEFNKEVPDILIEGS